jgi:hypothetical protein
MSKKSEVQNYIKLRGDKDYVNALLRSDRIIYGEFINSLIYYESNTLLPKTGILAQEDDELIFFGAKSILEKEFFLKFPYENIYLSQNSGFSISFIYQEFDKKKDKCKFSISWEDYITKNIKPDFVYRLSVKIKDRLLKKAAGFIKKNDTSQEAYYYYKRVLNEKIDDISFIIDFISLVKYEAEIESEGFVEIYDNIIEKKIIYLTDIYPKHKDIISKRFRLKKDLNLSKHVPRAAEIDYENFEEKDINFEKLISVKGVQKLIDDKIRENTEKIKEQLLIDYHEKIDEFSNKLELEKQIYREIIRDNIKLGDIVDLKAADSDKLIDKITNFYYRYKLLNEKLPDNFTIEMKNPDQGKNMLLMLVEGMSEKYIKIVDPYFFPSELELLRGIPDDIDIKIISYALITDEYKDKLAVFKQKLQEFREQRYGSVQVKLIKFSNRNQTPIHDRTLFSQDWGLSFSNSLSQIGSKHDIVVRRILSKEREITDFDDFWFVGNEAKRGGKILKINVMDI